MTFLLEDSVTQGLVFRQAPAPWVIILVIVPAILAFVTVFYRMGKEPSRPIRVALAGLRVLILFLLTTLMMDPALETQTVEHKKALALVLVDVSASMEHRDDYGSSPDLAVQVRECAAVPAGTPLDSYTRLDLVKRVVDRPGASLLDRLSKENDLRVFTFGESLNQTASLADAVPRERVTALGRSLERILDEPEVKSRPVGGLVVISDGKNTFGPLPEVAAEIARKRKIPIHTIAVGDPRALEDVEIVSLNAPQVILLGDTMVADLRLRQRGFVGQAAEIQVLENGVPLQLQAPKGPVLLTSDEGEQTVRVLLRLDQEGLRRLELRIKPIPGEFDTSNNVKKFEVTVRRERLRILYVDDLPRWEYRKLQDYLTRGEESFESRCLLLSAQVGFINESSRSSTPIEEFPRDDAELFQYDVLLFGDVDPALLSPDPRRQREILEMIVRFVEAGGGFAMIAGDRFSPWAYRDTPLRDILPVMIDPTSSGDATSTNPLGFPWRLTEIGRGHPIMQLVEDKERNERVWRNEDPELELVPSRWFAKVQKAKPGASVLAVHATEANRHGPYPILVAGYYGQGPVFFSAVDETWLWYRWQGAVLHHRYWGNVTHFLARTRLYEGNKRFSLSSNRSKYAVGDRVTLTAFVRDASFRPSTRDDQVVVLRHTDNADKPEERILLPKIDAGTFEKTFIAREPGRYEAWIPPDEAGEGEKIAPIDFTVAVSDLERNEPIVDVKTLETLAHRTGGRFVLLPEAAGILEEVSGGTVEIPRQRRVISLRSGDLPYVQWLPLLFVVLLAGEWFLRKSFRLL